MSTDIRAEFKGLQESINKLPGAYDQKFNKQNEEIKKLRDAIAEMQEKSQMSRIEISGERQITDGVKSMIGYIRTGAAPEVQYDESGTQIKAATVSNPPNGGYFAIPDFQSRVLQKLEDMSPMRQICETINVSGNISMLPYEVSPPTGKWVGETEKRNKDSDVKIGVAQIPVNEYVVRTSISNTLAEDSNLVSIEDYLINSASKAIDRDVGDTFVTGDGFNKPEGLYASKRLRTVQSGKAKAVTTDMLYNAMAAVPNEALRNARWTMSMKTFLEIVKQFGTDSSYVNMPLSQSIPASIFGYPVTFVNAPDTTKDGNICATFGDHYHAYKIVQRSGLQYQRDPYTGADDNMIITRFRTRCGGQLVMPEAVVGIKVGA